MKKATAVLLFVVMSAVLFSACNTSQKTNHISLFDLKETMLAAAEFGDMAYVSSEDAEADTYLSTVSDIDPEKVDSFSICYAKDGKGNADELVVIRVKNKQDVAAAHSTLTAHLNKRQSLYATYDPTQSEKIGKGITFALDNYAVLIVSDNNAAVKAAFEKAVKS